MLKKRLDKEKKRKPVTYKHTHTIILKELQSTEIELGSENI